MNFEGVPTMEHSLLERKQKYASTSLLMSREAQFPLTFQEYSYPIYQKALESVLQNLWSAIPLSQYWGNTFR